MKSEDKIVELLSDMLIKQDAFVEGISKVEKRVGDLDGRLDSLSKGMDGMKRGMDGMKREISRVASIQERQEKIMLKLLEIMDDDVPKFDQVIDIENLKDGSVILKRHQ